MDRVIQLTASNAEESATVAEEMSTQAFQMKDNVKDLLRLVGNNNGLQTVKNITAFIHEEKTYRSKTR
jgi:hypothetical protein